MAQSGRGTPEPQAPPAWRAPEGPEAWLWHPWAAAGTGELRGGARLWHPWAAGPGHTRTTGTAGVKGARENRGPGCGARGRWRGLAGLRDRPLRAVRLACGDLAGGPPPTGAPSSPAPQQDQTAPGTPAGPQTQAQARARAQKRAGTSRFRPALGAQWLSALHDRCRRCATGDQQRATRVSSARPPCRPCRSSRR